jgi:hypothetical protein
MAGSKIVANWLRQCLELLLTNIEGCSWLWMHEGIN